MDENNVLSVIAIVISVGSAILGVINHRRIRSHCCGKDLVASLDVETTTPPKEDLKINLPPSPKPPKINRIMMLNQSSAKL